MTKLTLSLLIALLAFPCQGANPTPEQIIDAFFGPGGIADKSIYYTGEMKRIHSGDHTLGETFAPGVTFTSRRLALAANDAPVYAVTIRHGEERFDWYAYFALDEGALKLKAVRTLGLSGISYDYMRGLAQRTERPPEAEWDYQNLRLAFLPDIERLAHFKERIADLDALKKAIEARQGDAVREKMRALHFRGYERNQLGQLEIWLGGGLMNSIVGVLYVPPGESPPSIDEGDHIYIEQIDGPWYVYKTT